MAGAEVALEYAFDNFSWHILYNCFMFQQ